MHKKEPVHTISVQVGSNMYAQLSHLAERSDLSRAQVIRSALRAHLARELADEAEVWKGKA